MSFLVDYLERVEAELQGFFPDSMNRGAKFFASYIGAPASAPWSHYNSLLEPARDIVARGGKRWRSLLLLLIAEQVCNDFATPMARPNPVDYALPLTSLIESVHAGTLVVDDIEDNSPTRRGKPAIHLTYGEDVAINSGNFMYLAPLQIIERYPAKVRLSLYEMYQRLLTRLHIGQGLDIHWHRNLDTIPTKEQYVEMTRLKTGSLARMAMEMGVVVGLHLAGSDDPCVYVSEQDNKGEPLDDVTSLSQRLGEIADLLGVAFQIQDDLLNITQGIKGKDFGDDLVEGKKSLPLILAVEQNPEIVEELTELITAVQSSSGSEQSSAIERAITLIADTGAVELAKEQYENTMQEIHRLLQAVLWSADSRQRFTDFMESLLKV